MYRTTKKDFTVFQKEAEYWIKYFGLINYEIRFDHCEAGDNRARRWLNRPSKICIFELGTKWEESPQKNEVKLSAFHEVCELLLGILSMMAEKRYSATMVEIETHDIIRRLENTIFKEKRG